MNKYLVIGSAGYIKNWYLLWGLVFKKKNYLLCPINNAWAVDPENVFIWLHSNDFSAKGTLHPTFKQQEKWKEIQSEDPKDFKPYKYKKEGSGTMLLNALCQLLNRSLMQKEKCIVALAGCDCQYHDKKAWFYGDGTPDPLRYGEKWLLEELTKIGEFYKKEDCKIYNVGLQRESLLPYKEESPLHL